MSIDSRWQQFARFCLIGGLSTGIYYGLYLLFLSFASPAIAYGVGYVAGIVFNICMHMLFTFKTGFQKRYMLGFALVYLVSMGVGALALQLIMAAGVSAPIAGLLVIGLNLVFNFLGMRTLTRVWGDLS